MRLKTISDYYDAVCEKFPEIPRHDIIWILRHGWRQFYKMNNYGCDVMYSSNYNYYFYCGNLCQSDIKKDSDEYKKSLGQKAKIIWDSLGKPYDGFYYFCISRKRLQKYKEWLKTHDIKTEKYNFGKVVLNPNPDFIVATNMYAPILRVPVRDTYNFGYIQDPFCASRVQIYHESALQCNYLVHRKTSVFKLI